VRRDAHRAFSAFEDEHTVFLHPDLKEPVRWREGEIGGAGEYRLLALPGERLDRLDVFHVGANRCVWGITSHERFPGGTVDGLLERFVNFDLRRSIDLHVPGVAVRLSVPLVRRGRIQFRNGRAIYEARVLFEVGHLLPISSYREAAKELELRWPIKGGRIHSVDVDAELCELAGSGAIHPERRGCFTWPIPFRRLFGVPSGLAEFLALDRMRALMRLDDRALALHQALEEASPYLSQGWSTMAAVKFWPLFVAAARSGERVPAFWEELGISGSDINEALAAAQLRDPCRVLRVWGGLGLLWDLLVENLGQARSHFCLSCGRLLRGRRRFCGPEDDVGCYRDRRTRDRQRERARERAQGTTF
jgi:hypothetical protein